MLKWPYNDFIFLVKHLFHHHIYKSSLHFPVVDLYLSKIRIPRIDQPIRKPVQDLWNISISYKIELSLIRIDKLLLNMRSYIMYTSNIIYTIMKLFIWLSLNFVESRGKNTHCFGTEGCRCRASCPVSCPTKLMQAQTVFPSRAVASQNPSDRFQIRRVLRAATTRKHSVMNFALA